MENYRTAEEKSVEWNISSRHVQYLCREGKIEGAVKRAGAWFIPDAAPVPTKNTKSKNKDFIFAGTKKRIFNSAIELFMFRGVNNVTLRDIANNAGVHQSTIYKHFKSKQEILDTIYDFYCHYYVYNRLSLKEMESKLQNESLMEIIRCIGYDFKQDNQKTMCDITKIILQRIAIDDRAWEISKSLMMDEGIEYVEAIFTMGIEMGRFAPFDVHAMAVFFNSIRIFTLYNWVVDPSIENIMKLAQDEQALYEYAITIIRDLLPRVTNGIRPD